MEINKIHILTEPMLIGTEESQGKRYLLPKGTTLYFDKTMPEGFDRYFLFVNIEGKPLKLENPEKPGLVAPISAYPIEKSELIDLINSYPLDKQDLARILKSIPAKRQDLLDILESMKD